MRAMILADFMTARKYFIQQIAIGLLVGIFICVATENIYVAPAFAGMTMAISASFSVVALDEAHDWQQFRLALPISRTSIVEGRYASLLVFSVTGIVAGGLSTLLVLAVQTFAPALGLSPALSADFEWFLLAFVCAITLLLTLAMLSLMLPFCFKMGLTKAVRFIPLAVVLVCMLAFMGIGDDETFLAALVNAFETVATPMGIVCIVVVGVALYVISCGISAKLYKTREF